jgi:hypothetical protein
VLVSEKDAAQDVKISPLGAWLKASVPTRNKPTHVFYDPTFLDTYYASVKKDLQSRFPSLTRLPPSEAHLLYMTRKAREMPMACHRGEYMAAHLGQTDLVDPVMSALKSIMDHIGQPVRLEAYPRIAGHGIVLAIEKQIGCGRLVHFKALFIFHHKTVPFATEMDGFQACVQLASQRHRLNYNTAPRSSVAEKADLFLGNVRSPPARNRA